MLRAALTIGGTIAGLAALLSFKSHPAATVASGTPAPPAQVPSATERQAPKAGTPSRSAAGGSGGASQAARTVTGPVVNTQYGPMQVQLTLAGQRITKVNVLQRTDTGDMSNEIDSAAIPKLTSETLTAQSARIDAVSGASYTSSGYIQSLQSALDKARA
jgi:uncharacterized protein with FMN-binding domain